MRKQLAAAKFLLRASYALVVCRGPLFGRLCCLSADPYNLRDVPNDVIKKSYSAKNPQISRVSNTVDKICYAVKMAPPCAQSFGCLPQDDVFWRCEMNPGSERE